jgi:hypothetical protein
VCGLYVYNIIILYSSNCSLIRKKEMVRAPHLLSDVLAALLFELPSDVPDEFQNHFIWLL